MVGGSFRVLRLLPPLKLVAMMLLKYATPLSGFVTLEFYDKIQINYLIQLLIAFKDNICLFSEYH
jgi:hypothetical protein